MNFAVIAAPRTGSTHFTGLLHAHDNIICHGEIFHPKRVFVRLPKRERSPDTLARLAELRRKDPADFLSHIFSQNHGCAHVGFKIFAGHNDEVLGSVIRNAEVRKIVLLRQNILASYSSSAIKKRFGRSATRPVGSPQPTVEFNAVKFLAYRERITGFYRSVFDRLAKARQHSCVVNYEQIDDPWLFSNLLQFIGAETTETKAATRYFRHNSSAMLSRFSNPDEVTECLRQHDLMGWLYESSVSLGACTSRAAPERIDGNGRR